MSDYTNNDAPVSSSASSADNITPDFLATLSGTAPSAPPPDNYVMAPADQAPPVAPSPSAGVTGSPALAANPPDQSNAAAPQKPSLWRSVLEGALRGAIGGSGAKNFAGGIAKGGEAVLAARQQDIENQQRQEQMDTQKAEVQSNIKFRDAQAAALAVDAKIKDIQLQNLPEQLRQQQEDHSLAIVKEFQEMGIQPRLAVPDTGKDAMIGLQQLHNSDGSVPSLYTVHAGGQILAYDLNQLTGTPQGLDVVNQAGTAQGRPPITQQQWQQMTPASRTDLMNKSMNFFNPTPSKENATILAQQYKNYLASYSNRTDADPTIKARLQNTYNNLSTISKGLQDQEVATETRKSAINLRNQQAMEDYRDQQKDARTYGYALDANGEMHYVSKADADRQGMKSFEPQTPATVKADLHDQKVLNDVAIKSNAVRDSLAKVSPTSFGPLAKILDNPKMANPENARQAIGKLFNEGILSKDDQDYAIRVLSLRESSMGLQKVLTGSARSNESQINALMKTLPGVESSADVANRKLDAFNQNLDMLRQGVPKQLPGTTMVPLKSASPTPVIPAGAQPAYKNGTVVGYRTPDGKVTRF